MQFKCGRLLQNEEDFVGLNIMYTFYNMVESFVKIFYFSRCIRICSVEAKDYDCGTPFKVS